MQELNCKITVQSHAGYTFGSLHTDLPTMPLKVNLYLPMPMLTLSRKVWSETLLLGSYSSRSVLIYLLLNCFQHARVLFPCTRIKNMD